MPTFFELWRSRVAMSKAVSKLSSEATDIRNDLLAPIGRSQSGFEQLKGSKNLAGNKFLGHIELWDCSDANASVSPPVFYAHNVMIYSGLVIAAFDAACVIFESKDTFQEVGQPQTRSSDELAHAKKRLRRKIKAPAGALESDAFLKTLWKQLPACPVRAGGTLLLYEAMLRFFSQHELAHAALGHCLFVRHHLGLETLREAHSEEDVLVGSSENILQLLEYEADITATITSMMRAVHGQHPEIGNHPDSARFTIIGIHLALWLVSDRTRIQDAFHIPEATHPNVGFRQGAASQGLRNLSKIAATNDAFQKAYQNLAEIARIEDHLFGILELSRLEILQEHQMHFANRAIRENAEALSKLGRYRFVVPFLDFSYDGLDYSKYSRSG